MQSDRFTLYVHEAPNKNGAHTTEAVSYLAEVVGWPAMTPGAGEWNGHTYEAANTANDMTHNWYTISFNAGFSQAPRFIAGPATYNGRDPAALRYKRTSLTSGGVQVMVEEDTAGDGETDHTSEVATYLAGVPAAPLSSDSSTIGDMETARIHRRGFGTRRSIICTTIHAERGWCIRQLLDPSARHGRYSFGLLGGYNPVPGTSLAPTFSCYTRAVLQP